MTLLEWTKPGRFADHANGFVADGPGVYDVPDDLAESYLNMDAPGWERPDEEDAADAADAQDADGAEGAQDVADAEDADGASEAEAPPAEDGAFDAAEFVGNQWNEVADAIRDGEVDDHLVDVREAEHQRDNGPRDSVIDALDERESGA